MADHPWRQRQLAGRQAEHRTGWLCRADRHRRRSRLHRSDERLQISSDRFKHREGTLGHEIECEWKRESHDVPGQEWQTVCRAGRRRHVKRLRFAVSGNVSRLTTVEVGMTRKCLAVMALAIMFVSVASAQDAKTVIANTTKAMGLEGANTLQYSGPISREGAGLGQWISPTKGWHYNT